MLKTRITELFGIRYPIISAPMVGYSGGSLAAAVSSAGGLGTFGAASSTISVGPDYVREQIRHIRSQTDQPFGVGFITHYIPVSPQNFEVVLEEAVPVVLFSFAAPEPWLSQAKQSGAITVCQVQTLEAARGAIAAGADVLVAQGNEAGGHTGTMNLLPFLVRLVEEFPSLPIVAAGGLATGRSLAAVLTAGAEGAWMGTVFLATREAQEVSEAHKELIVQSSAEETIYTQVFDIMHTATFNSPSWPPGIAARGYNNAFAQAWHGRENALRDHLDHLIPSYAEARQRRDLHTAPAYFGESASFVHAIHTAEEVLCSICEEAERLLRQRAVDLIQ
ncbi:MAG TPA: nitronate monooxygenase [Candidatus Tectomicrobia bacterium]